MKSGSFTRSAWNILTATLRCNWGSKAFHTSVMLPCPRRSCNSRSRFVGIVDSSYSREVVISNCTHDSESHAMRLKRGADTYFQVKDSRNNSACQCIITVEVLFATAFLPLPFLGHNGSGHSKATALKRHRAAD